MFSARGALLLQMGSLGGKSVNPPWVHREVVMRVYDEREELEATGEWLKRINRVGFSEELTYVPSRLAELGVAPKDVVDRLDWLKEQERDTVAVSAEPTGAEDQVQEEITVEEQPEPQEDALPYSQFGLWEWVDQIDVAVEEAIKAIFEPDPEIPEFNELALLTKRRARGKRARTASLLSVPELAHIS